MSEPTMPFAQPRRGDAARLCRQCADAEASDGRRRPLAYSANAGVNTISIVDTATRKAVAEIKVGRTPKRLLEVWAPAE